MPLGENGLSRFAALRTVVANQRAGRLQRRKASVAGRLKAAGPVVRFFYRHAMISYNPATEILEEGRLRGAYRLAMAEMWLQSQRANGSANVEWIEDWEYDPADYDSPDMPAVGWSCLIAVVPDGPETSLHAITFEGDGHPDGKPYKRVAEAELALEIMDEYWPEDGTDGG